jgi:glycosyltransferase involved in cell wall biosynthesis
MQQPLVSIVLPFTNEKELLKEAVDSLIAQSFSDFELLLVDNSDDEKTRSIASAYSDERIIRLNEPTRGIAFALNTGIRHARGTYIARMDADDIAHPRRLEFQLNYLEEHAQIGAVACRTGLFPATEDNEGFRLFVLWQNSLLSPADHYINRFIESPVAHPSMMFRKKLIEQLGYYSTDEVPEDYELWLRWMDNQIPIAKLEDELLHWRDREIRLSRTGSCYSEESFFEVKARYLKSHLEKNNISENKEIIVCGGSKNNRWKIEVLKKHGIIVNAVTDVVSRNTAPLPFIPAEKLHEKKDVFIINLISKRDVRESIRRFLQSCGYTELEDFIMAG